MANIWSDLDFMGKGPGDFKGSDGMATKGERERENIEREFRICLNVREWLSWQHGKLDECDCR